MGVSRLRNPLFGILGVLTPVQRGQIRNAIHNKKKRGTEAIFRWSQDKAIPCKRAQENF